MSNPATIFVRPAKPGLKVPDPATNDFLPEEGRDVTPGIYWDRRVNDGDVIVGKPAVKSSKKDA